MRSMTPRGLVFAQRADQHLAQVVIDADAERGLALDRRRELGEHLAHFLARNVLQLRHRGADALHILRAHVLHDFGGFLLAERQQQNGGALRAVALVLFVLSAHERSAG